MRLAVSNFAWPADRANEAYAALAQGGATGLEIAPGLLFPGEADPFDPSPAALTQVKAQLADAGLVLCSMQSLLFGVSGAALFGDAAARAAFEAGLTRAARLAERLGIANLVMGSPKNRVVPEGLSPEAALDIAIATFRRLGDVAREAGCVFAIEPNPAAYGTNFLTTVESAADFVRQVDHPGVRLNFDVGTMHVNGVFDRLAAALKDTLPLISHVHLSEANLAPFPLTPEVGTKVITALRAAGWDGWVSIEMLAVPQDPIEALRRALAATRAAMEGRT